MYSFVSLMNSEKLEKGQSQGDGENDSEMCAAQGCGRRDSGHLPFHQLCLLPNLYGDHLVGCLCLELGGWTPTSIRES